LKNSGNVALDWQRWFRKAIQKSAEQAWGAERWIRRNPARIFLDRQCKRPLPIDLPKAENAKFHLVVVAHGISPRIRQEFGGSGSLIIDTTIQGSGIQTEPFAVGDLDPQSAFVHILDDDSLLTLMNARDTISDFVAYLSKRADLLRSQIKIRATGEEQLLAIYLRNLNARNEHDFIFPTNPGEPPNQIFVLEGHWEDFQNSRERIAQLQRDKISYLWDSLIEKFNIHALKGDQYFVTSGGIKDTEKVLHFMASEPRWKRSHYSRLFGEMLKTTSATQKRLQVLPPTEPGDPYYFFFLFPLPNLPSVTYDQYREVRRGFLEACCKIIKLNYPDAKDIVGIATESGLNNDSRSEDAIYFDAREWKADMETEAKELQAKLGILQKPTRRNIYITEYPEIPVPGVKIKNPRNKKCPCGSGKKYKHCCLNKSYEKK
jgi:SEC-C motif